MDKTPPPESRFAWGFAQWLLFLALVSSQTSCESNTRSFEKVARPKQESFIPTQKRYEEVKQRAENDASQQNPPHIRIDGDDILLPPTGIDGRPSEKRTYTFYIFVDDGSKSVRDLVDQGELRISVVGTDARIDFLDAIPGNASNKFNQNVARITVESAGRVQSAPKPASATQEPSTTATKAVTDGGVEKILQSFSIFAWFPQQYAIAESQQSQNPNTYTNGQLQNNPWVARRDVNVYYGDIRTRVQIVSTREAEASFGKAFAQHFFVGRVYLRNRNPEHALAVYTTSMRVPVLFYRKTGAQSLLTPEQRQEAVKIAEDYYRTSKGDPSLVFIWSGKGPRRCPILNWPYEITLIENEPNAPTLRDQKQAIENIIAETVFHRIHSEKYNQPVEITGVRAMVETAIDQLRKFSGLGPEQLIQKLEPSFPHYFNKDFPNDQRNTNQYELGSDQLRKAIITTYKEFENAVRLSKPDFDAAKSATEKLLDSSLQIAAEEAEREAKEIANTDKKTELTQRTKNNDTVFRNGLEAIASARTPTQTEDACKKLRQALVSRNIHNDGGKNDAARTRITQLADRLKSIRDNELQLEAWSEYLKGKDEEPEFRDYIKSRLNKLIAQANTGGDARAPFGALRPFNINFAANTLAYSQDPRMQRVLLENGYLWRDAYRPMTFQAVLNSLIFNHDDDPTNKGLRWVETLARVAGGAVGLSGVFNELGNTGYLQSVNFFSAIVLPELRKQLITDLNKHITNLGEMAMDSIVILQPQESYDRYVFFPRDPIYNFPDEYDPIAPAYIASIQTEELVVEAVPVQGDRLVRGGSKDAQTLVERALNEGEKTAQTRLLDQAAGQAKLRTVELANLIARIDALMSQAGDDPDAQRIAKAEIGHQVAVFTQYFGPDNSGALALELGKYSIHPTDTPPLVLQVNQLELAWGTSSTEQTLAVLDDQGTDNLTLTVTPVPPEKNAAGTTPPALVSAKPLQGLKYVITADSKPDNMDEARATVEIAVEDKAKNRVTRLQSILLRPPTIAWGRTGSDLKNDDPIHIPAGEFFALELQAKFKDTDTSRLEWVSSTQKSTNLDINPTGKTEVIGQTKTVRARFRLEPKVNASETPNESVTFTLKLGDQTIATQKIRVVREKQSPSP